MVRVVFIVYFNFNLKSWANTQVGLENNNFCAGKIKFKYQITYIGINNIIGDHLMNTLFKCSAFTLFKCSAFQILKMFKFGTGVSSFSYASFQLWSEYKTKY